MLLDIAQHPRAEEDAIKQSEMSYSLVLPTWVQVAAGSGWAGANLEGSFDHQYSKSQQSQARVVS